MVKQVQQTIFASFARKNTTSGIYLAKSSGFPEELESADPEMTSSMALHSVHSFIKMNRIADLSTFQKKTTQKLRFCRVCDKFNKLKSIKTCYVCEDHYHRSCHQGPLIITDGKFICYRCQKVENPLKKCKVCSQSLTKKSKKVTCQYCKNVYHGHCLSSSGRICKRCEEVRKFIPQKRGNKIIEDQRIKQTNRNLRDMFEEASDKQKQVVNFDTEVTLIRKGCSIKAMTLINDRPDLIQKYKQQMLEAIRDKKMNYTEDLKDIEFHFHHMGEGNMNFGLHQLSPKQEQEYFRYKKQPIGPFKMQFSQQKGWGVVAAMNIPKGSIICEYVGEVVTMKECIDLESTTERSDSLMDLWKGRNSDESLMIRPWKWTNIARFINGAKDDKSDLNVQSQRVAIRGVPAVLLIAKRQIKKGESLCYDYNAGGIDAKFDTSTFV